MGAEAAASESVQANRKPRVSRPRPGHADLAGALKFNRMDIRDVLERASARETAARVAAGAIARQFLEVFNIEVASHVTAIGGIKISFETISFEDVRDIPADAPLRCVDRDIEQAMVKCIDSARAAGDTVGGAFEVILRGLQIGLGNYAEWDRKLDGSLAQAVM